MRKDSLEFLRSILNAPTPSGYESPGQKLWCQYARKFADEVHTDAYGNAVAVLNPKGDPKIMLDSHMDEIGLMIRYIDDKGFIYFQRIGGVDPGLIRAKRVNIHAAKGIVRGVIGAPPIHLAERDKEAKVPKLHESFIDIGAKSRDEALKKVALGDPITFSDEFELLNDHIAVARAMDNRAGSFAIVEALRLVSAGKPKAAVYAAAAVQEEVGLIGAQMNVVNVKPDAAVAVDVTHATDVPAIDVKQHGEVKLGKGPCLSIGRENHPAMLERFRKVAKAKRIELQYETFSTTGGTDAMAIYKANGGVPSQLISIPNRYMHTTVEVLDLNDLDATVELIAAFCLDVKKGERFAVKV